VKLQTKILVPLALSTLLVTGVVFFILHSFLMRELLSLEREDHARNVSRVVRTIEASHRLWAEKMADWAMWDDVYDFIESRNPEFIRSNGFSSDNSNTFEVSQMDMVLFLNNDLEAVLFAGQDYRNKVALKKIPVGIRRLIAQHPQIFEWNDVSDFRVGFIQSGPEVIQIVMRPITDTAGTAPIRGTFFYARFFRGSEIQRLEKLTGFKIEAVIRPAGDEPQAQSAPRIEPVSSSRIRGTATLKDIFDRDLFDLSVTAPRYFYHQGLAAFRTALLLFLILCLLLIWGMSSTIDRIALRRLSKIDQVVEKLKNDANSDELISLARLGRDEIGRMAQEAGDIYLQVRLLADYDGLTSLHNARYFRNALPQIFEMAKRHDKPLSLLMFDIDHFKKINDTHGHLQGDRVLEHLGKVLRRVTRASDLVVRYGGEEFAAVLPESGADGARIVAEKIREAVTRELIPSHVKGKAPLQITVSMGIATLNPRCGSGWDLVHMADRALYRAKSNGRDRIETADPDDVLGSAA
jgi:diguanylate cyclase (GGDEF)-like protein